jgi:hypothetical protein
MVGCVRRKYPRSVLIQGEGARVRVVRIVPSHRNVGIFALSLYEYGTL